MVNKKPTAKISVIIPCFKRKRQTGRTIELLFGSKGWNNNFQAEIIVTDSTPDDSLKNFLLKKFAKEKERGEFFYLKPKKIGIAVNKNAGAKKARYPLLVFCDSDMEIETDTLLKTIAAFKKYPKAAGLTGKIIWRGGENNDKLDRPRAEDRFLKKNNHIFVEMIYSRYFATYKDIFWQVGGYDENVFNMRGEGADLSTRYWRAGFALCFEPKIKVFHREDAPNSIALRVKKAHWKVAKDMWLLALKYNNFENFSPNFAKTLTANFSKFTNPVFEFLDGLNEHNDFIKKSQPLIKKWQKIDKAKYPFQYLETFSPNNRKWLNKIIS